MLTYQGETRMMSDWAAHFEINYHMLRARIQRGWTVEEALTAPAYSHPHIVNHSYLRAIGVEKQSSS